MFVSLDTECLCKFVSLVMFVHAEHYVSGAFRQNRPQPTQAQLMRGEFPETLFIEQGVVLSCTFADWKVRMTSRVLSKAVVSPSSENSNRGITQAPT